jgi:hypothetical protein
MHFPPLNSKIDILSVVSLACRQFWFNFIGFFSPGSFCPAFYRWIALYL